MVTTTIPSEQIRETIVKDLDLVIENIRNSWFVLLDKAKLISNKFQH